MRQGCVLGPRLFCSVLQLAMEDWRCDVSNNGLDLGDGGPPLLDLRFADDILLFAGSAEQLGYMLDKLVTSLGKVGLKLNAGKTKVLITQAQPPKTLTTRAGLELGVLDQSSSHKWLGCMFSTANRAACARSGLLARRAPLIEQAWVRVCREALGGEGRVVPQQWLARTTAPGVGEDDRRRLDLSGVWGNPPWLCPVLRRHLGLPLASQWLTTPPRRS